jgi:predicted RNA-binding protein with PUA-like domain
MRHWLMKSEPGAFSLDHLRRSPNATAPWDGVRNYQARNYMRDQMRAGDGVLFYHSSTAERAIVGWARVARAAYPDHTAWDTRSDHYDPRSTPDNPVWMMVDIAFEEAFPRPLTLDALRAIPALKDMLLLRRGMRLSIQPVTAEQFETVLAFARGERAPPVPGTKARQPSPARRPAKAGKSSRAGAKAPGPRFLRSAIRPAARKPGSSKGKGAVKSRWR